MTPLQGFCYGVLGGVLPEIYALYKLRYDWESKKPKYLTSPFYWVLTVIMILIGGGTVCLYLLQGSNINEFMAIHLGVSTPLILASFMKEKPVFD